jgi:ATP-dependent protease HslVU (ClpYQ) peptidase subunit
MTVIVSVKINDGVVLASDSAATFGTGQIYHHAEKVVNLVKGLPVGVMVTGAGGLGSESITTILKDLRRRLSGRDRSRREWAINPDDWIGELIRMSASMRSLRCRLWWARMIRFFIR